MPSDLRRASTTCAVNEPLTQVRRSIGIMRRSYGRWASGYPPGLRRSASHGATVPHGQDGQDGKRAGMGRLLRAGVALAACVAILGVASASASASVGTKKISDSKYAKTLCGKLTALDASESQLVDQYNGLPVDDPATFQRQAAALVDSYLADIKQAAVQMKKVEPDVGGGKKISKTFVSYFDDASNEIQTALDTFRSADPNSPAFQGDVTVFETSLKVLSARIGDPFSKVTNQELLGAFKKEKSCSEVVSVT